MLEITENVRLDLNAFVPSSSLGDIVCFSFYDNHPRDDTKLDIIVCTSKGEIKEFFQRELVLSTLIGSKATDIRLLRNNNCDLFYLVATQDELIILSRKNTLKVLHRLTNVEKYEIEDLACCGQARLKIFRKDDAVPLLFDENFENLSDSTITQNYDADDSLPIVRQLMRKLTEAKYTVQSNEKAYEDLLKLRQQASFSSYSTSGPLVLKRTKPCIKLCNNKIVIVLDILQCKSPIQDLFILLNGTTRPSITYTSKLYKRISEAPFWNATTAASLNQDGCYAIVCIVDLEELKYNITSRLEFNGVISYKVHKKELLLPFQKVSISALDTMSCEFDVLSKTPTADNDDKHTILCLMATTYNMELSLRHIKNYEADPDLNVLDLFCRHLGMDRFLNTNMIVHRNMPFHTLHGVMMLLGKNKFGSPVWNVSVYARNPSQILALINYIQDAIPHKIIISTTNQRISSKACNPDGYNDDLSNINVTNLNYTDCASSILNQTSSILNYLDNCMIKMSESKDPSVLNQVGVAIDPHAAGFEAFNEFRRNILDETSKGISTLINVCNGNTQKDDNFMKSDRSIQEESMIIESD